MLCSDSSFFTELWNFRLPFSVFLYYHKQSSTFTMNGDKQVFAVFADEHVDDVTAAGTPVEHIDTGQVRLCWNEVWDPSELKGYLVEVNESIDPPECDDGNPATQDTYITKSGPSSTKEYYA